MVTIKGKRVLTSLYLDPAMAEELKELSLVTRVPQAVYLREAVELMLVHYRQASDLIAGKNAPTKIPIPPTLLRIVEAADRTSSQRKRQPKVSRKRT
jgi:predicted DNA-binding protein